MGLTCSCIAIIIWLVVTNVPVKEFGVWPRVLIIVLLAIFTISSFASTEIIPWSSRSWFDWRRPRVLGMVIYLLLGAAGFIAGISNAFDPPADQGTQNKIRRELADVARTATALLAKQDAIAGAIGAGQVSLARSNIPGVWGEVGCSTSYRFSITESSLSISAVAQAKETGRTNWLFTIDGDVDAYSRSGMKTSTMTTTEREGYFPNESVKFVYMTDGAVEKLQWRSENPNLAKPELVRCQSGLSK